MPSAWLSDLVPLAHNPSNSEIMVEIPKVL